MHSCHLDCCASKLANGRISRLWPTSTLVFLLLVLFTAKSLSAEASGPQIMLVKSGAANIYQQLVQSFEQEIKESCLKKPVAACRTMVLNITDILDSGLDEKLHGFDRGDLVVTIGKKAAEWLHDKRISHKHKAKALYTLIPKSTFKQLSTSDRKSSAIFLDQPFERLVRFSKLITPGDPYIGALLGPSTKQYTNELAKTASRQNVPLILETVESSEQTGGKLRKLLSKSNVLLALPDPEIYNRKSVVGILLSSYHSQVPVIGFSSGYVKAGALAAVYSTPGDIGRQISDTVKVFLDTTSRKLKQPAHPVYFRISVNENVSKSMGISLPSAESLESQLLKGEER